MMAVTGTTLGNTAVGGVPIYNAGTGATSQGAQGGTGLSGQAGFPTQQNQGGVDTSNLSGPDRDAALFLTALFTSYGMGTLAPQIVNYLKQGYSSDTIAILLQGTPEYKARFKANDARLAKGLAVLSPAEYISTEESYRKIMAGAGLPSGFYDSQDALSGFIANDVSPTELQGRVTVASDLINSLDPATTSKFASFYGGNGSLVAYALDPKVAEPLLEKQFQTAQIAARDQGLGVSQAQAEQLAGQGISAGQATSGFGQIGRDLSPTQQLASIYGGEQYTLQDALDETFGNSAAATLKRQRLVNQEQGAFGGTSGVGQGSLTTGQGGQF